MVIEYQVSKTTIYNSGITLKEYLEEFNMTKLELAKRTSFTIEYRKLLTVLKR